MPHFMIVLILYINLLNLSWIKKMSDFEGYGKKGKRKPLNLTHINGYILSFKF